MEIGPLSEWVTAIAELLAVCVALFLPYVNSRHEARQRGKKIKATTIRLTKEALKGDRKAKATLDSFSKVGYLTSSSDIEFGAIKTASRISEILKKRDLTEEDRLEIETLLETLKY